jgi:hypothetical protein
MRHYNSLNRGAILANSIGVLLPSARSDTFYDGSDYASQGAAMAIILG